MKIDKQIFILLFILSIFAYLIDVGVAFWLVLILSFSVMSIINIKNSFDKKFPFGEIISFVFFVDNTLALSLIHFLKGNDLHVGDYQYIQISIENYLPFSFLCSQAILLGYMMIKPPQGKPWIDFIKNFDQIIDKHYLRTLIGFGAIGSLGIAVGLSDFFSLMLFGFLNSGLIGFALYTKKPLNIYVLIGLGASIGSAAFTGMFGDLIFFIFYYVLIYLLSLSAFNKKIQWPKAVILGLIAFYFLALVQNVKTDYRARVVSGGQLSAQDLYKVANKKVEINPANLEFYMPLLGRLNQGFLVSAVMYKVPSQVPYANGSTVITSAIDALVPRFLNPDKEEAGGRKKILQFTNITLIGNTSMNVGLLGESYANFGKIGSVIFFLFYGLLIALFEKTLLNFSLRYPIILVFFPIYFQFLVGSGTDFLMVLNGIVKSSLIIFGLILLLNWKKKEKNVMVGTQ